MTDRTTSILTAAERTLLAEHGQELLDLEERYGSQQAALDVRPDLADVARALQVARAQSAATALGLRLRRDARPFPERLLADLERTFARLVAQDDRDAPGDVTAGARLARLLDDDGTDQRPQ
jgi:hypothetical protein